RVDFGKIGRIQRPADRVLVESLLEAIGRRGTILAVTHSPTSWSFRRNADHVFEPQTAPCVAGRLAEAILQSDSVYRSGHPTCSMAGIGARARELLADHDHQAACFAPVKRLIEAGGKMLLIGCTISSPGFSTVHHVYEDLGLATRSLLSGWVGCYFRNGGRVEWFAQRDIPGCSMGFPKFYPLYEQQSVLRIGPIATSQAY